MRANDIIGNLVSVRNDWSHILANPRFTRRDNIISWYNYERIWLGEFISAEDFHVIVDKGQYSFQIIEDGGIIQLFYEFDRDGETLISTNLAYVGPPVEVGQHDPEPEMIDTGTIDESNNDELNTNFYEAAVVNKWIRLDYTSDSNDSVIHGRCHLHIGSLPNARLLVKGVPGPAQFVEWVIAMFYPEVYRLHRLMENGEYTSIPQMQGINSLSLPFPGHNNYDHMAHIQIPLP